MAGLFSSFFDPTGKVAPTYEELQQRKKIAAAIMARQQRQPKNLGEGLQAIGEAYFDRMGNEQLLADERATRGYEAQRTANQPEPPTPQVVPYEPGGAPRPRPATTGPRADLEPDEESVPPPPAVAAVQPPRPYAQAAAANILGPQPQGNPQSFVQDRNIDTRTFPGTGAARTDINTAAVQLGQDIGGRGTPSGRPGANTGSWLMGQANALDQMGGVPPPPGPPPGPRSEAAQPSFTGAANIPQPFSMAPQRPGVQTAALSPTGTISDAPDPAASAVRDSIARTQMAQASPFPAVSSDASKAIIPGGGLSLPPVPPPPPPPPPAARPPGSQIEKVPDVPIMKAPTTPRLQPMVDDYVRRQQAIAEDPRMSDTSRSMAMERIKSYQSQINEVNKQTLTEYNDYRKRYDEQQTPEKIYGNEKSRRGLVPEGFFALTEQERAQLPKVPGVDYYKDRWGNLKEIKAPASTNVNVDTKGATEEAKIRGKLAAERENEVIAAGNKSGEELTTIARAEALLAKIKTGALEPNRTTIAALGKSIGVSDDFMKSIGLRPEEVGSRQAFQAIVNELTLGRIGPGGMPSNNFSEGDRKFLERTEIGLGDDDESNRIKLAAARKKRELHIERAERWGDFREAHPDKSFAEFERIWNKELKTRNEFGELNKRAEDLIQNAQQGPHQAGIPPDLPTATTPVGKIVTDGQAAFRRTEGGWERLR